MPLAGLLTARSVLLLLVISVSPALSHAANNITAILAERPDLGEFSRVLTFTRLADDINARNTITVLAVDDARMAPLMARRLPRETLHRVLSLHVLVDYYDDAKLHRLPGGSAVVSTLFQASGDAPGSAGMVRIADRRGGRVAFAPQDAADGARAAVFYVRPVKQTAYNISVLQVSAVISSPAAEAPASSPEPSRPNVTDVMPRNGCSRFAALVADAYPAYEQSGTALTFFCPADKAVKASTPLIKSLTAGDRRALVWYHIAPRHYSMPALKAFNGDVSTLDTACNFTVRNVGGKVTLLSAARNPATVTGTLMDTDLYAIHVIDGVLLPPERSPPPPWWYGGVGPAVVPPAAATSSASIAAPRELSFGLAFLLALAIQILLA